MDKGLTVLMAVHNGSPYLRMAIDSILQQTFHDFCFLIVDDASTDDSREIVGSYDDPRIELMCLESNLGQTGALNVGLRHASTPWIARMDADDYSSATKFQEQMGVLESDHSLKCVGTNAWTFNDDPAVVEGEILKPDNPDGIMQELLRGSPIIHGTIIINKDALLEVGAYNESYRYANDVELFDLPVATIRPFNTYGPRQSARAVIPAIITQSLTDSQVNLGSLEPTRDFTFVADTVNGFIQVAESIEAIGQVTNIGSGSEISIGDLAKSILELVGKKDLPIICENQRIRPDQSEVQRLYADTGKARRTLDWRTEHTLEEGLIQTIEWIRNNLERYRNGTYAV